MRTARQILDVPQRVPVRIAPRPADGIAPPPRRLTCRCPHSRKACHAHPYLLTCRLKTFLSKYCFRNLLSDVPSFASSFLAGPTGRGLCVHPTPRLPLVHESADWPGRFLLGLCLHGCVDGRTHQTPQGQSNIRFTGQGGVPRLLCRLWQTNGPPLRCAQADYQHREEHSERLRHHRRRYVRDRDTQRVDQPGAGRHEGPSPAHRSGRQGSLVVSWGQDCVSGRPSGVDRGHVAHHVPFPLTSPWPVLEDISMPRNRLKSQARDMARTRRHPVGDLQHVHRHHQQQHVCRRAESRHAQYPAPTAA